MWAETVVIRADSWMPMNGDPGAAKPGYVVEILKAICKDSGLTLDYQLMPWEESLEAVKAGKIDGVIGASAKEAAGLVVPTECIGTARVSLWLAKDKLWRYRDVDSLAKVKLGVNSGYSYWDAFDEYTRDHPGPQIVEFSGDNPLADMIKKLKAGELDVVPETEAVFLWNVRELGFSTDDFRAEYTHTGDPVFVAFAAGAKGERLAKLLDAGMAKLRKSGELARILERYGVTRLL
jgi:polar amino acid transport system substrate-binding protein